MTMIRPTVVAAALVFASGTAWAAPADYEDRLPQELNGMALQDAELRGDMLIAYYGQSVGRATLRIIPAPETDASGVAGAEPEVTGESAAAQRVLFQMLDQNLAAGTNALREGFQFSPVRLMGVDVEGTVIACGVVERLETAEATDDEEPMKLIDRICTLQNGEDVLALTITTPVRGQQMEQAMSEGQLVFAGTLIGTILQNE